MEQFSISQKYVVAIKKKKKKPKLVFFLDVQEVSDKKWLKHVHTYISTTNDSLKFVFVANMEEKFVENR